MNANSVIAVVDIGSNALRWAVMACKGKSVTEWNLLERGRDALRLGEEVFVGHGRISDQKIARLILSLREFLRACERHTPRLIRVVATSAMREAANREGVIEEVFLKTGLRIEIIPGIEEARLVQLAVSRYMDISDKLLLLVDIGGGSVEVSLCDDGEILSSESVNSGGVRLLALMRERAESIRLMERLIRHYSSGYLRQLQREQLKGRSVSYLVGTGGNLETLLELQGSVTKEISLEQVQDLKNKLISVNTAERILKFSLREDRADVIVPAILLIERLMSALSIPTLSVPGVGLREGVIIELAQSASDVRAFRASRKQLVTFALELGRRFQFLERHATKVAELSTALFNEVRHLVGFGDEEEVLLTLSALLHDIGQIVSMTSHHKHSRYLINATPFIGLSESQRSVVACIARYHRRAEPSLKHPEFMALNEANRQRVRVLASILRVADALDRDHTAKVKGVSLKFLGEVCELKVIADEDISVEEWGVMRKGGLFESVFGCKLKVLHIIGEHQKSV
jgi:exopolyphosphatase/guanosine-5'-triphosphate,3'-diphosphate pyrophosphatase